MWKKDITEEDALTMMKKGMFMCGIFVTLLNEEWIHGLITVGIDEVKARLVVAPPKYIIKVIDKNGIRVVAEVWW